MALAVVVEVCGKVQLARLSRTAFQSPDGVALGNRRLSVWLGQGPLVNLLRTRMFLLTIDNVECTACLYSATTSTMKRCDRPDDTGSHSNSAMASLCSSQKSAPLVVPISRVFDCSLYSTHDSPKCVTHLSLLASSHLGGGAPAQLVSLSNCLQLHLRPRSQSFGLLPELSDHCD